MRIRHLVTLAALVVARDSALSQSLSVGAQAIPLVTRADPTATRTPLSEGYLSQPAVMAHASWRWFNALGTANFEGLTLRRGELTTGGYGEGYVDRRHPHSYVHELLIGATAEALGTTGSLFVGRGFAPFGSDDPMVRPFEKYPVNHHLAQILERVVAVAAIRRGPVIAELGVFNGDEPYGPDAQPKYSRFADSWSSRLTWLPVAGLELSGSVARVKSPEEQTGAGLDQQKASIVARFEHESANSRKYALAEWAQTNERDGGETITSLGSMLGELAYCRAGIVVAGRVERTDRPEEERLLDPFRSPRPALDLSNHGVSRWTTIGLAVSAPTLAKAHLRAKPFVEVQRIHVGSGNPSGLFDPDLRFGASRMWMLSAGLRLSAGMAHHRMGRYGVAASGDTLRHSGTHAHHDESDQPLCADPW